jgi:hypothetical protein
MYACIRTHTHAHTITVSLICLNIIGTLTHGYNNNAKTVFFFRLTHFILDPS